MGCSREVCNSEKEREREKERQECNTIRARATHKPDPKLKKKAFCDHHFCTLVHKQGGRMIWGKGGQCGQIRRNFTNLVQCYKNFGHFERGQTFELTLANLRDIGQIFRSNSYRGKNLTTRSFVLSSWAVVVAQLVERPLLIPEVRGSNLVIGKNVYIEHLFTVNCIEKTKIKEKEAVNGTIFFKKILCSQPYSTP